jgi:hypothetical protein
VSCPQERPEGQKLDTSPSLAGEITAAGMSDGIELRFGVDFDIMLTKAAQTPALSGLTGDTETPLDDAGRPSVVLRRMSRDDNLWDLAKQYRTTRADLKTANDLESEESAVPGTLLLVPRCR